MGGCSSIVTFKLNGTLPNLQILDLHDCRQLTDQALLNIGMGCSQNLVELNLAGCNLITSDGINKCNVFSQDEKFIIIGIPRNAKLKHINLNNCKKIDSEGVTTIANNCPLLVTIKLDRLTNVNSNAISNLAKNCKGITGNTFFCGNTNVTRNSIIKNSRP